MIIGECVSDQDAPFPLPATPRTMRSSEPPRSSASGRGDSTAGSRRGPCRSRRRRVSADLLRAVKARGRRAPDVSDPPPWQRPQARKDYQARHGKTPTEYLGVARRARAERGAGARARRGRRRDRVPGAHGHEGRDVPGHRREGRPRRPRARAHAGASRQGRQDRARLRLAQQLEPSRHRARDEHGGHPVQGTPARTRG